MLFRSLVPDAPTLASAGLPGYASELIVAVFGPAGIPAPLVTRLNQEYGKVLAQPDIREKFLGAGVEARGGSVDDLVTIVKSDMAKWGKVVRESGLKVE